MANEAFRLALEFFTGAPCERWYREKDKTGLPGRIFFFMLCCSVMMSAMCLLADWCSWLINAYIFLPVSALLFVVIFAMGKHLGTMSGFALGMMLSAAFALSCRALSIPADAFYMLALSVGIELWFYYAGKDFPNLYVIGRICSKAYVILFASVFGMVVTLRVIETMAPFFLVIISSFLFVMHLFFINFIYRDVAKNFNNNIHENSLQYLIGAIRRFVVL